MRSGRRTRAILVVALACCALLGGRPAWAETLEYDDAASDMSHQVGDGEETAASEQELMDVQHVVVRHAERVIRIKTWFRALEPSRSYLGLDGRLMAGRSGGIVADDTRTYSWAVVWRTDQGESATLTGRNGLVCRSALKSSIDWEEDFISLTVPRRCVDRPRWISVDFDSFAAAEEEPQTYRDNAFSPSWHSSVDWMGPLFRG